MAYEDILGSLDNSSPSRDIIPDIPISNGAYADILEKLHDPDLPDFPPPYESERASGLPWEGYYYSAYGIAVKHGYTGTEEEWIRSLKGEPGEDGVSPEVTVTEIEGGHRITITDADGTHQFDVMDGDMSSSVYDANNEVADAGGIAEYVEANADPSGSAATVQANLTTHVNNNVKHITDAERSSWNGKQAAISDLDSIRSGAESGTELAQTETDFPALRFIQQIRSGNLDDYKSTGLFYTISGNYSNVANLPPYRNSGYYIEVLCFGKNVGASEERIIQRAKATLTNLIYQRYNYNGTWRDWVKVYDSDDFTLSTTQVDSDTSVPTSGLVYSMNQTLAGKQEAIGDLATIRANATSGAAIANTETNYPALRFISRISSGSMNDYKTTGLYFVQSADVSAENVTDLPTKDTGYYVEVLCFGKDGSSYRVLQRAHSSTSDLMYTRWWYTGTLGAAGTWHPWAQEYTSQDYSLDDVMRFKGYISSGGDLNNYTTTGMYYTNNDVYDSYSNLPNFRSAYWIEVHSLPGGTHTRVIQIARAFYNSNRVFIRRMYDGTWQDWVEEYNSAKFTLSSTQVDDENKVPTSSVVYSMNEILAPIAQKESDYPALRFVANVPSGGDLNDYVSTGLYYIMSANYSSIVNKPPTAGGYALEVKNHFIDSGTTKRVLQTASNLSTGKTYVRDAAYTSAATVNWSDWAQIYDSNDFELSTTQANSTTKVPTSSVIYSMNEVLTQISQNETNYPAARFITEITGDASTTIDLNTYKSAGIYFWKTAAYQYITDGSRPPKSGPYYLEVYRFGSESTTAQRVIQRARIVSTYGDQIYSRSFNGSSWNAWVQEYNSGDFSLSSTQVDSETSVPTSSLVYGMNEAISGKAEIFLNTSVTIPLNGWTATNDHFTNTVSVDGLKANDRPIISVPLGSSDATNKNRAIAWSKVYRAYSSSDGSITFYAWEKPAQAITVMIKVVR